MDDFHLLETDLCWIIFRFADNSLKMIHSTLRSDFLDGLEIKENSLYDFETKSWFCLDRVRGSKIEVFLEKPQLREVDLFANQFIR